MAEHARPRLSARDFPAAFGHTPNHRLLPFPVRFTSLGYFGHPESGWVDMLERGWLLFTYSRISRRCHSEAWLPQHSASATRRFHSCKNNHHRHWWLCANPAPSVSTPPPQAPHPSSILNFIILILEDKEVEFLYHTYEIWFSMTIYPEYSCRRRSFNYWWRLLSVVYCYSLGSLNKRKRWQYIHYWVIVTHYIYFDIPLLYDIRIIKVSIIWW